MNVSKLCTLYLEHAKIYYRKPSGRQTSEYALLEHATEPLLAVAGDLDVQDVTGKTLAAAREWILHNRPDNCRRTVNAKVSRMIRIFRWGGDPEREYVPELVVARLMTLRPLPYGRSTARETPPRTAVPDDQLDQILAYLKIAPRGHHLTPQQREARVRSSTMIELQLETGMRPGELCSMRVEDIDRDGPMGTWLYHPAEHKTQHRGKVRVIPIFPEAQHLLTRWLTVKGIKSGPIFDVRRDSYTRMVARTCERAGLPHWSPHQLRHAAAVRARRQAGLEAAQALLGHASTRTTEVYAPSDTTHLVRALHGYREKRLVEAAG